jgi:hypothetical protein
MKDGRTHLAHKTEHAVDLETGAVVAVTVQGADQGDTTTSTETLIEAAEQIEAVVPESDGPKEVVADKGYRSNHALVALEAVGVRSYISEPDRGRRNWRDNPQAQNAVYRNRRRIRGKRGKRLLRQRGELLERPFGPSVRNRSDAPCLPAGSPQHPQAHIAARRGVESRFTDANTLRCWHAAEPAGPRGGVFCNCMVARTAFRNTLGASSKMVSIDSSTLALPNSRKVRRIKFTLVSFLPRAARSVCAYLTDRLMDDTISVPVSACAPFDRLKTLLHASRPLFS